MAITQSAPVEKQLTYTPLAIVNLINNSISVKEEKALIIVKGVFHPGGGKHYNGYFYDNLKEETGSCVLPMKVSAMDRTKLKPGCLVEVKGFITRKVDDKGIIKVYINVTEVMGQTESAFTDADIEAFALMQKKAAVGFRDVEGFLASCVMDNKKPVVKIAVGQTAIVDSDIRHGFGEAITYFEPEFVRINLSSVDEIIRFLTGTKAHVLVIARGGGTGVEVFNSAAIAQAALECRAMLVSAVGHKEDVTLIDKMVDKSFITPTDLGNFFRQVYNRATEQLANSKGKLIEEVTRQVRKEFEAKVALQGKMLEDREKQIQGLQGSQVTTSKLLVIALLALVIGFFLAYILKS